MKRSRLVAVLIAVSLSVFCACGASNDDDSARRSREAGVSSNDGNIRDAEAATQTVAKPADSDEDDKDKTPEKDEFMTLVGSTPVGEYITFGRYVQSGEWGADPEPLEWRVLAHEEGRTLVISKHTLFSMPYNTSSTDVTWETCSLRSHLNNSFYNSSFNDDEKKYICEVTNENPDSGAFFNTDYSATTWWNWQQREESDTRSWDAPGGNDTVDKIFCLSAFEAYDLFESDEDRQATATDYVIATTQSLEDGVMGDNRNEYWLRTPGWSGNAATEVTDKGMILHSSVDLDFICVRPALWIISDGEVPKGDNKTQTDTSGDNTIKLADFAGDYRGFLPLFVSDFETYTMTKDVDRSYISIAGSEDGCTLTEIHIDNDYYEYHADLDPITIKDTDVTHLLDSDGENDWQELEYKDDNIKIVFEKRVTDGRLMIGMESAEFSDAFVIKD